MAKKFRIFIKIWGMHMGFILLYHKYLKQLAMKELRAIYWLAEDTVNNVGCELAPI